MQAPNQHFLTHDHHLAIMMKLTELETKLDSFIKAMDQQDKALTDLRVRVEALEKHRARQNGITTGIAAFGGAVGSAATLAAKYFF